MNNQRLKILLPVQLIKKIDKYVGRDCGSRRDFIRQALIEKIRNTKE